MATRGGPTGRWARAETFLGGIGAATLTAERDGPDLGEEGASIGKEHWG